MLDSLITIAQGVKAVGEKEKDGLSSMQFGNSLIDFAKPARVEPITMIDSRLEYVPEVTDVLNSTVNVISGYYLQAVSMIVNVGNIDVIKMLDRLNPSRDPLFNAMGAVDSMESSVLAMESYKTQLPFFGDKVGLENYNVSLEDTPVKPGFKIENASGSNETMREMVAVQNLSVGKNIAVALGSGNSAVNVMVNVRLISTIVPNSMIQNVVDHSVRDLSFSERWDLWRSGQIGFWKDLVFCQDLIDEHKKVLNRDTTHVFSEILKRRRNNGISALFSGKSSVATSSNILLVSSETRKEIERKHGFKFKDTRARAKIFNETYLMLLIEIDPEMEHVTFYHRNIDLPSEMTFRQIKSANKSTGPDIGEILKAYRMGSNPSMI